MDENTPKTETKIANPREFLVDYFKEADRFNRNRKYFGRVRNLNGEVVLTTEPFKRASDAMKEANLRKDALVEEYDQAILALMEGEPANAS